MNNIEIMETKEEVRAAIQGILPEEVRKQKITVKQLRERKMIYFLFTHVVCIFFYLI